MIEPNNTCGCGTKIVAWKRWSRLTEDQRAELLASGFNRSTTGTECRPCYQRRRYRAARRAAGYDPQPRDNSGYTRTELLEELDLLNPAWRNQPVQVTCRTLAPRLGMKPRTLEQRLRRYGFRSRFGHDGQFRGEVAA